VTARILLSTGNDPPAAKCIEVTKAEAFAHRSMVAEFVSRDQYDG